MENRLTARRTHGTLHIQGVSGMAKTKTSSAVKRKYNDKAYKQWFVQLKPDFWDEIEQERAALTMSRAEYLAYLKDKKKGED